MQLNKNSKLYWFLQRAYFPALIVGLPAAAWLAIQNNVHFAVATYAGVAAAGLLYFVFERLMPYRPHWNQLDGDLSNDLISGTVAYGILPKILSPLYIAFLAGGTAWLASLAGGSLWPSDWPIAAQVVLLMLAGDAGRYWGHRLAHEVPFLWRFHAVHHSATRLWFWNATRQHPVDKAWFTFTELLVPTLMGVHGEVLGLYLIATAVCGFAQHCNVDLKLGPLYWLFNVVELHRWHHSKKIEESDNNYGNNLIVYDRIFGTYFHPENNGDNRGVGEIGLLNPDYPKNYLGQLAAPFKKGSDKPADYQAQP
jgi:sterol desaturase/sphingolipid hydroxylase (fatty acid hydroxylase superfamily)